MQLSHIRPAAAAKFDDPNLVAAAGLVPVMALAQQSGLLALADEHLSVPTDKGANAGCKIGSLVAGIVAGADSIADMAILRHGAMTTVFDKKSHHVPGRLIVRRIPDLRPKKDQGQRQLFDVWRFHAFFTTTDPAEIGTVAADQVHRRHATIEQVHADLKNSALAHLPSAHFCANAAWLVCAVMAFNLTRAAATLTADPALVKASTGTIRRALISVPTRIATSARRLALHLPTGWPWEKQWITLFTSMFGRNRPITA